MNFAEAKAVRDALERELSEASAPLKVYPRNAVGLVSDEVRGSPEYRAARGRADLAFAALRKFNGQFVKRFKRELRAERREREALRGVRPLVERPAEAR